MLISLKYNNCIWKFCKNSNDFYTLTSNWFFSICLNIYFLEKEIYIEYLPKYTNISGIEIDSPKMEAFFVSLNHFQRK